MDLKGWVSADPMGPQVGEAPDGCSVPRDGASIGCISQKGCVMRRLVGSLVVLSLCVGCMPTIKSARPMGSSGGTTFLQMSGENMPEGIYACTDQGGKPVCKIVKVEAR